MAAFNNASWRSCDDAAVIPAALTEACRKTLQQQWGYLKARRVGDLQQRPRVTYLLDIEGTTTPLPFVTKVLFPFAEAALEGWVGETVLAAPDSAEARLLKECMDLASLDPQNEALLSENKTISAEAFVVACKARMQENSKVVYLKKVQGLLWQSAYESGRIKGHVLPDAAAAIAEWGNNSQSTEVQIYSSGSIFAQKLLFGFSTAGDLSKYIAANYDPSSVGLKTEPSSFANIRRCVGGGSEIVFITDSLQEIEAAVGSSAVDRTLFCLRPMNNAEVDLDRVAALGVPVISSFTVLLNELPSDADLNAELSQLWTEMAVYRSGKDDTQLKTFT